MSRLAGFALMVIGISLLLAALDFDPHPLLQAEGLQHFECKKARHCTSGLCLWATDAANLKVGYYCCTAGTGYFWACVYRQNSPCPCVTAHNVTDTNTCTTCYFYGTDSCPPGLPATCGTGRAPRVDDAQIIRCIR